MTTGLSAGACVSCGTFLLHGAASFVHSMRLPGQCCLKVSGGEACVCTRREGPGTHSKQVSAACATGKKMSECMQERRDAKAPARLYSHALQACETTLALIAILLVASALKPQRALSHALFPTRQSVCPAGSRRPQSWPARLQNPGTAQTKPGLL